MATQTATRHCWNDMAVEAIGQSIGRRFITGERMTVCRFDLKRGGIVPRHSHDHEQISCVLSGALKFDIDGEEVVVRAGEVMQIPSWVPHGVDVLEDAVVIDVFSPVRQDWLDKTDTYFQR